MSAYCEHCGSGESCGVCGRGEVVVQMGGERAQVWAEGGLSFQVGGGRDGWAVTLDPSREMVRLALAARSVAFPGLARLSVADLA